MSTLSDEKFAKIVEQKKMCVEWALRALPNSNKKDILDFAKELYEFVFKTKTDD